MLFHIICRQCPLKLPTVNGNVIDLYKLYKIIVSYGGWVKVREYFHLFSLHISLILHVVFNSTVFLLHILYVWNE